MHIWGIDLSLVSTGIAIFDDHGNFISTETIKTSSKNTTQERLRKIGDEILVLLDKYPLGVAVLESSFTKFNKATQMIYRVHGVANYLLSDYEQIYYAPTTVKKVAGGSGRMDKDELRAMMEMEFGNVFSNTDESDAAAIGKCYFINRDGGNNG